MINKPKSIEEKTKELLDITFPMNTDVALFDGDSRGLRERWADLIKEIQTQTHKDLITKIKTETLQGFTLEEKQTWDKIRLHLLEVLKDE